MRYLFADDPLSADKLQSTLWPDEIHTLEDYREKWPRLCAAVGPIVIDILKSGISVVLDFPGNTKGQRAWMLGLAKTAGAPHKLYFIDIPDEICKERLAMRNASGDHAYAPTEAQFDQFTAFFTPPSEAEGLTIIHVEGDKQA